VKPRCRILFGLGDAHPAATCGTLAPQSALTSGLCRIVVFAVSVIFSRMFRRNEILNFVMDGFKTSPRRIFTLMAVACVALLAFGLYLQHVVGLEPCPMCIVQRYALILIATCAGFTGASRRKGLHYFGVSLIFVLAISGAFVAARQSWLQWYPPEVMSCGRDLYGMIETFPLKRLVPMIFRGGGDCTKVDWTFLGGSIANWSLVWFSAMALVSVALLRGLLLRRR
jgi:disulfide bond formation protein DsbB